MKTNVVNAIGPLWGYKAINKGETLFVLSPEIDVLRRMHAILSPAKKFHPSKCARVLVSKFEDAEMAAQPEATVP